MDSEARTELASESGVLLDHGADVDIEGGFYETPLQVLLRRGITISMYNCRWIMMQKSNKSAYWQLNVRK